MSINDLKTFRRSLYRLCTGSYSRGDIENVVTALTAQTRRFLFHREKKQYQYRGQWENGAAEMNDLAIDFIAHLFARNESGVFVELQQYFSHSWDLNDEDFKEVVYQLLNSVIQQQSIRLFKERDPFGKAFYRSLRYLQNKHAGWNRTFIEGHLVMAPTDTDSDVIPIDGMVDVLKASLKGSLSLTEQLEQILAEMINNRGFAVPVEDLLTYMRALSNVVLEDMATQTTPAVDSFIYDIIEAHIRKTVQEIDTSMLQRYEEEGKLTSTEREGFRKSVRAILVDHADGGCRENYYSYLSNSLEDLDCTEKYKNLYRTRFEYVAKTAKSKFSANVESALSMQ